MAAHGSTIEEKVRDELRKIEERHLELRARYSDPLSGTGRARLVYDWQFLKKIIGDIATPEQADRVFKMMIYPHDLPEESNWRLRIPTEGLSIPNYLRMRADSLDDDAVSIIAILDTLFSKFPQHTRSEYLHAEGTITKITSLDEAPVRSIVIDPNANTFFKVLMLLKMRWALDDNEIGKWAASLEGLSDHELLLLKGIRLELSDRELRQLGNLVGQEEYPKSTFFDFMVDYCSIYTRPTLFNRLLMFSASATFDDQNTQEAQQEAQSAQYMLPGYHGHQTTSAASHGGIPRASGSPDHLYIVSEGADELLTLNSAGFYRVAANCGVAFSASEFEKQLKDLTEKINLKVRLEDIKVSTPDSRHENTYFFSFSTNKDRDEFKRIFLTPDPSPRPPTAAPP